MDGITTGGLLVVLGLGAVFFFVVWLDGRRHRKEWCDEKAIEAWNRRTSDGRA